MRTLAIDTATDVGVVAVVDGGLVRCEMAVRVGARHGETLLAHCERALTLAGIAIGELDLIAIGLGPGSFTGVRIGVATAKGLALACGAEVVGIPTTRTLARAAFGALRVPVVDAHKDEVFVCAYAAREDGSLEVRLDEMHGSPEAMGARVRAAIGPARPVLVGTGLPTLGARFVAALGEPFTIAPRALEIPRGAILALEAEEALARRGPDDLATLVPRYVRAADAVLPGERPSGG